MSRYVGRRGATKRGNKSEESLPSENIGNRARELSASCGCTFSRREGERVEGVSDSLRFSWQLSKKPEIHVLCTRSPIKVLTSSLSSEMQNQDFERHGFLVCEIHIR